MFAKPARLFLLIQALAVTPLLTGLYFQWPLPVAVGLAAVAAFTLARVWHEEVWWQWIHLVFLPAVFLTTQLQIESYWFLLAFVLTWLIFGRISASRVPLFLSEQQALDALAKTIPPGQRFLDVGAGTGRVLAYLAQHRPDLQLSGVEMALLPWLMGRCTLDSHICWLRADYQTLDFADYDCIYAYLSPAAMPDLWRKARAEMKEGAVLISNSFAIDEQEPTQTLPLHDWKNGKLLIWQM